MRKAKLVRYGIIGLIVGGLGVLYSDHLRDLKERVYQRTATFFVPLPEEIRRKRHMDHYHRFGSEVNIPPFKTLNMQTNHLFNLHSMDNILPVLKKKECTLEGYFQALEETTSLDFRLDSRLCERSCDYFNGWWKAPANAKVTVRETIDTLFSFYDLHTDPVGYGNDRWIDVWSTQNL
ncbi:MAG: hypothetical protein AABX72_00065 [Nanoarchaeota archaeon]